MKKTKKLSKRGQLYKRAKEALLHTQKELLQIASELEKLPNEDQRWFLDKVETFDKTLADQITDKVPF